jgi:hypothetical protein
VPNHEHLLRQKKNHGQYLGRKFSLQTHSDRNDTYGQSHAYASMGQHPYGPCLSPAGPRAVLGGDLSKINAQTYRETDSQHCEISLLTKKNIIAHAVENLE